MRRYSCVVFPTSCNHSEIMYISQDLSRSDDLECPLWPEDADLATLFPRGARGIRIREAPGTTYRLKNAYMVFISADNVSALPNHSIARMFNRHWLGNIAVVKIGVRDGIRVINMSRGEQIKVDDIVGA